MGRSTRLRARICVSVEEWMWGGGMHVTHMLVGGLRCVCV